MIEANKENRALFEEIFSDLKLKNTFLYFDSFVEARRYIFSHETAPFLFFSNVLHFGENTSTSTYAKDMCLKMNCPCLFYSILFTQSFLIDTYSTPPKSYFVNPSNELRFKQVAKTAIQYWCTEKSAEDYTVKWNNKKRYNHKKAV